MDIFKWYYQRRMLNAMVQNSWAEAERYAQKLIDRSGSSMGLQYNLALIALGGGRTQDAYDLAEQTVRRYGESLRLCRLLGDISYLEGHREQARSWYTLSLDDNPGEKERHLIATRLEILESEDCYIRAHEAFALIREANDLMEGQPEEAKRLYLEVVGCDPTQVEALNNLGVLALEHDKDARGAIEWFTKVLTLVDHHGAGRNLAKARKALKDS